jgi:hypothetical protein
MHTDLSTRLVNHDIENVRKKKKSINFDIRLSKQGT